MQNTVLAAILTFSDRLIYPAYAAVSGGGASVLDDQATAGSLVFLIAAMYLAIAAFEQARSSTV